MTIKDNSGTLSENTKATNERHPNFKGKARISGIDYYISGWSKTGNYGDFTSLSFQRVDEAKQYSKPVEQKPVNDGFVDDMPYGDAPF